MFSSVHVQSEGVEQIAIIYMERGKSAILWE